MFSVKLATAFLEVTTPTSRSAQQPGAPRHDRVDATPVEE